MARVEKEWMFGALHGRPNRKSGVYLRGSKKTGKVYAVERTRERHSTSEKELAARERFARLSKACTAFVKEGRAAVEESSPNPLSEAYLKVLAAFNAQSEVAFLRSFVMKYYARMDEDGSVRVVVDSFIY